MRERNRPGRKDSAYLLEISPRVWSQVGVIPGDHFTRIRERLKEIAASYGKAANKAEGSVGRHTTTTEVDRYVITLEVDPENETLLLRAITPKEGRRTPARGTPVRSRRE